MSNRSYTSNRTETQNDTHSVSDASRVSMANNGHPGVTRTSTTPNKLPSWEESLEEHTYASRCASYVDKILPGKTSPNPDYTRGSDKKSSSVKTRDHPTLTRKESPLVISQEDSLEKYTYARQSASYVEQFASALSPEMKFVENVIPNDSADSDQEDTKRRTSSKKRSKKTPRSSQNSLSPRSPKPQVSPRLSHPPVSPRETQRSVSPRPQFALKRDIHRIKEPTKELSNKPIVKLRAPLKEQLSFDSSDSDSYHDAMDASFSTRKKGPLTPMTPTTPMSPLVRQNALPEFGLSRESSDLVDGQMTSSFSFNGSQTEEAYYEQYTDRRNSDGTTVIKSPTISEENRTKSLDENHIRRNNNSIEIPKLETRSKSANDK